MEQLYNRTLLPSHLQPVYDRLLPKMAEHAPCIVLEKISLDELKTAYEAVLFDMPLLLLGKTFSYSPLGSQIFLEPHYMYSAEETLRVRRQLDAEISRLVRRLKLLELSPPERLKSIYDFFRTHIVYDQQQKDRHSPVSALLSGRSVCTGISLAFRVVCGRAMLNVAVIGGSSDLVKRHNHAWNVSDMGHLDLTNDLQNSAPAYFCLGENVLRAERWFPKQAVVCEGLPENEIRVVNSRTQLERLLAGCRPQTAIRVKVNDECANEDLIASLIKNFTPDAVRKFSLRTLSRNCYLIRLKA